MNIGVVVVTYNRLEKLKITLNNYDKQTVIPKMVLVVNNASTDDTKGYLDEWKIESSKYKRIVINQEINSGGSGGFYTGIKSALLENDIDWFWIADDDAFPERDLFENICSFSSAHKDLIEETVAISAVVKARDGIDYRHRRRIQRTYKSIVEYDVSAEEYLKEYFEFDLYSFVGTLIKRKALENAGLPNPDFFIFYDDSEHSMRIAKEGKIICLTNAVINHDINATSTDTYVTWKMYYGIRNYLVFLKSSFPHKYYYKQIIYFYLVAISNLIKKNRIEAKITNDAIHDAIHNKLGLHDVYKPGWQAQI